MPRFDAVLLDYGNTVVQFDRAQIESIHGALAGYLSAALGPLEAAALGAVMDDVCVRSPLSEDKREMTACEQMGHVLSAAYGRPFATDDEDVVAADREYQRLFVEALAVDERAVRAIEEVRSQVPVGLISNYPCGATLRRSLERIGLGDVFWPIVISGEVGYVKPHAKLFAMALEALGLPGERVLLVGDSWANDMVGAHQAGMATCHLLGLTSDRDLEERYRIYRPDFTIEHLAELPAIVNGGG
jgi:HAD superfamily hydrolase (TIGR01509 family)